MLKPKFDYSLINKNWICEVFSFKIQRDSENHYETSIELTLKENDGLTVLHFSNVSQIEFESRYSQHGGNLEITDVASNGMEYVNLMISGFIDGAGNFRFWANNIIEVK